MFVLLCCIKINVVFNDNISSFDIDKSDNNLNNEKIGINTSKFYSDKSPIKLYNRQGTIFVDLNNKLYKIDLKEIINFLK